MGGDILANTPSYHVEQLLLTVSLRFSVFLFASRKPRRTDDRCPGKRPNSTKFDGSQGSIAGFSTYLFVRTYVRSAFGYGRRTHHNCCVPGTRYMI